MKELDARISTDMTDIKAHIGDLADRTHRLEQQVDEGSFHGRPILRSGCM